MSLSVVCRSLSVGVDEAVLLSPTSCELNGPGLVALTGTNGAGKTTLLKCAAGRQIPSSGECLVNDGPPFEQEPQFRAQVASLIDTPPMARDMTLLEQVGVVSASWGSPREEALAHAAELLEELTIGALGDRFPYELSAGQLQLTAIALTLARPFDVLLLDEPERHLDEHRVETLVNVLQDRVDDGALIITATHRPDIINWAGQRLHLQHPDDAI